jgi:hypothetical protein
MSNSTNANWGEQGHQYLLLTFLALIFFAPFILSLGNLEWLIALLFIPVVLTTVRTVSKQPRHFAIALVLGTLSLAGSISLSIGEYPLMEGIRLASTSVLFFWIALLLLGDLIVRGQTVTLDLIYGSVNIYLLVGFGFSLLYGFIEYLHPGAFRGTENFLARDGSVIPFTYFSFVTMTTLGYGDIVPLTSFGATAAWVQAVFGQLYLAILVARLVGAYMPGKQDSA